MLAVVFFYTQKHIKYGLFFSINDIIATVLPAPDIKQSYWRTSLFHNLIVAIC